MSQSALLARLRIAAIMAILAAAMPMTAWAQEQADGKAANAQVEQLYRDGKFAEAMPIAEQTLAQAERTLGSDHPDTLTSVKNLADIYQELSRAAEAEQLFTRALEGRERVLGAEHPDTLVSVNDLAVLHQTQGRYAQAELLFKRGLEARQRLLGSEHLDTLLSASNLASIYQAQGRAAEAEPLLKRTLEARERTLGAEHPDTLVSLRDLADFYRGQGRHGEAEPLLKRALEVSDRVIGKDHPDTLATVNNLAAHYVAQGRYGEAEPLFKRALEARERLSGAEHRETLVSVGNLGALYKLQGRLEEAEPLFKRAADGFARALGKEHPQTLVSVNNLGTLYDDLGRYAEAEPRYLAALEASERVLGKEHSNTLNTANNLATLYQHQGRLGEAELLFRRALEARERLLGFEHPETLVSVNNLANLEKVQGRYGEAEPLYKRALAAHERLFGPDHPTTLVSLNNLADLYDAQGRYSETEPLYARTLEMRERVLGKDHPDAIGSLNNLAAFYKVQGRYTEAEPLLKRAVEAFERALGPNHPNTLASLNNLASLYDTQGRAGEAEPLYLRALETRESVLGKEHPATVLSVNNLATFYEGRGRLGEAEALYLRAVEAAERVLGKEHPDTLRYVDNLAGLYRAQSRYTEAEALYKRTVEARERVLGPEHPDTILSVANLAFLYPFMNRDAEAKQLYGRALEASERVLGAEHPNTLGVLNGMAMLDFVRSDWSAASQAWRRGTAAAVRLTLRGTLGTGLTGNQKSEAEQAGGKFWGLIKSVYRLAPKDKPPSSDASRETFQAAQWALSSEAARSLAQMAARGAKGDPELSGIARERQDLVAEWQTRDALRNAALGDATDKRNTKAEAENRVRLASIDERIAQIDKRLAADFPDYAALASPSPLSVKEVQAQLGPKEALVLFLDLPEFGPTPDETFIWVVTKTKLRWVRSKLGTAALTREVQALRCGLDEEEWATVSNARRCGDLLALTDMPDASRPLPFSLAKAHALYQALFGQIEDLIDGKRLLIVPSGALTSLPFQVLVTKKPKVALPKSFQGYRDVAWLGRGSAIATLPAVSSLKALRQYAAERRPAVEPYAGFGNPTLSGEGSSCRLANSPAACPSIGAPQRVAALGAMGRATIRGDGGSRNATANMDLVFAKGSAPATLREQVRGLCPLDDTAYEINCVAARFKGRSPLIRLAGEATEASIKALSENGQLARYRVLHFATHGLLSGDVETMARRQGEPALVLTPPDTSADDADDGLLMASEVAALKLNADWVVMSACNTAAGDKIGAQALSGLARAFFYAGGRTLLVSHWPVYSDAAVRLTTSAFAELDLDPKAGRAEALQRAMTALMDDPAQADNAHPAVWAPFVVVGEAGFAPPPRPRGK